MRTRIEQGSTATNLDTKIAALVDDAARIVYTADRVVNKLSIDNPNSLNKIIDPHYDIVCGLLTPTWAEEKNARPEKNAFFWKCLTIGIADQFRGFTIRNKQEDASYLAERTFTRKTGRDGKFWGLVDESGFARPWFLISFREALDKNLKDKALRFDEFERILEKKRGDVPKGEFSLTRLAAIERLVHKALGGKSSNYRFPNEDLLEALERKLTRGNDLAGPLEVSLLMRTLGGRYLNGSARCAPEWRTVFHAGVKYVLEKQHPDGSWDNKEVRDPSPLLHSYSPLLHLLDLSLDVLSPYKELLTQKAAKAVAAVREELDLESSRLMGGDVREPERLFASVCAGLSLGASVYDRFKDLLSKSILDDLGAKEGKKGISAIPSALGLQGHLDHGIITPWVDGSSRRPGTILMFGPPGTGKTTIASRIANDLNEKLNEQHGISEEGVRWRFVHLTPADFAREGRDSIVASAERVFKQLMRARRCVVLLDEMEEFLRARGPGSDKESNLITTAFLPLLQEAGSSREILLIVATNFVGAIDPAVTRRGRFDMIIPLGPPDETSRRVLLRGSEISEGSKRLEGLESFRGIESHMNSLRSKGKTLVTNEECLELVVTYTMGYTLSEIDELCRILADELKQLLDETDGVPAISKSLLAIKLWKIRADRVPTALSWRPGCNWLLFADEARRYSRPPLHGDKGYWDEPRLPAWHERTLRITPSEGITQATRLPAEG